MPNQIWTDALYVYASTTSGMEIYDITSESKYAYINYTGGFNTVWGNDDLVFVGTSNDGVKYINKTCISGSVGAPYNLDSCLVNFSFYPGTITSNNVRYIHGSDKTVMVLTESGINVKKYDAQSVHSYTTMSGGIKCFLTSQNKGYYIVNTNGEYSINRIDSALHDWLLPDVSYITGSGIFTEGIILNDMFVTELTSSGGLSNTIFCATSSGAYVIDEQTLYYDIYYVEV